jgi:hypothetical protein
VTTPLPEGGGFERPAPARGTEREVRDWVSLLSGSVQAEPFVQNITLVPVPDNLTFLCRVNVAVS